MTDSTPLALAAEAMAAEIVRTVIQLQCVVEASDARTIEAVAAILRRALPSAGPAREAEGWTEVTDDPASLPHPSNLLDDFLLECACGFEDEPHTIHHAPTLHDEHERGYHRGCRWHSWPSPPAAGGAEP